MSTKRERGDYRLPGQEQKGFLKMPLEMSRALCRFQGSRGELQIFVIIYEETVNWGDEWYKIPNYKFSKKTGIPIKKVYIYTKGLLARRMIKRDVRYAEDRRGCVQQVNFYAVNPVVSEWDVSPKQGIPQPKQSNGSYSEKAKPGIPRLTPLGIPRLTPLGIPRLGGHLKEVLKEAINMNVPDTSGTQISCEKFQRRKHPPDDKEKAEFSRILADFYKEHPHKDLVPAEVEFFYKSLTERYPDVDLIFVLQQKIAAWRKKVPMCFRQRPKNSKVTQEQNPRDLLDIALAKEQQRTKDPGR